VARRYSARIWVVAIEAIVWGQGFAGKRCFANEFERDGPAPVMKGVNLQLDDQDWARALSSHLVRPRRSVPPQGRWRYRVMKFDNYLGLRRVRLQNRRWGGARLRR